MAGGIEVLTRTAGLLLAAIAVQLIADAVAAFVSDYVQPWRVPSHHGPATSPLTEHCTLPCRADHGDARMKERQRWRWSQ